MSAVDDLRVWFGRRERAREALVRIGDTVETRAILELADRLDKLEADPRGALAALRRYKHGPSMPPITALGQRKPRRAEGWMNIHRNHRLGGADSGLQGGVVYLTREEADAAPGAKHRADCIQVRLPKQPSVHWRTLHDPRVDQDDEGLPF